MIDPIKPPGSLAVVATPIGNLGDMPPRAVEALRAADVIAAEDTRHSAVLTRHFGISTPLMALHEHNEHEQAGRLIERIRQGESVALISDAGTPLISDPGYQFVRAAQLAGLPVRVFPGACAAVAALSVSGLPSDRFVFEGFLPAKAAARQARLKALASESRTLLFHESSHRIRASVADMADVLGGGREVSLARELTKLHEESVLTTLNGLRDWLEQDSNRRRGEFVLTVAGCPEPDEAPGQALSADTLLRALLPHMPLKTAVATVVDLTTLPRNEVYHRALALRSSVS